MAEMLSEHFSVSEFEYSETALAKGINNKMNDTVKSMAKHTAQYLLENIRTQLNKKYTSDLVKCVILNITSGYRSLDLNKAVGGVNRAGNISQHCKGMAADINAVVVYNDGTRKAIPYNTLYEDIKQLTKEKKLYIDQCIQEQSKTDKWVHVSLCAQISNCRYQFLKYVNGTYTLDCTLK